MGSERRFRRVVASAILAVGLSSIFALSALALDLTQLRQRAEAGDAKAQTQLAYMYELGAAGVPKDQIETQALNWFVRAAKLGDSQARGEVRKRYFRREYLPESDAQGDDWWQAFTVQARDEIAGFSRDRLSAEKGDKSAQINLAHRYLLGVGTDRDRGQAALWARKAAEGGSAEMQCFSAVISGYDSNWANASQGAQAVEICGKAAEDGSAEAQLILGHLLSDGRAVPEELPKAAEWYRKSADQGRDDAQLQLGMSYENGSGVPKDPVQALAWYRKAAEQGNSFGLQYSLRMRLMINADRSGDPKNLSAMTAEHFFDWERDLFPHLAEGGSIRSVAAHMMHVKTTSPEFPSASCPFIEYPRESREAKEEGTVAAAILVNPDGSVQNVKLETTSGHPALDQASIKGFEACRFESWEANGTKPKAPILIHQKWAWRYN